MYIKFVYSHILVVLAVATAQSQAKPNISAITGVAQENEPTVWESYYRRKGVEPLSAPADTVKKMIPFLKLGQKVLCPAMGEGRNALYLAGNGFIVTGNDISETAVKKVRAELKSRKIQMKTNIGDVNNWTLPYSEYDAVLLSYFYDDALSSKWKSTIKSGGLLAIESLSQKTSLPKGKIIPAPTEANEAHEKNDLAAHAHKHIANEPPINKISFQQIENEYKGWEVLHKQEIQTREGIALSIILKKP